MASTTASRCSVIITLSGWCIAFLVLLYGLVTPDSITKWTAPSRAYQDVGVAQDTGNVYVTKQGDSGDCMNLKFGLLQEMVRNVEDKLLALKDEPRQNFSNQCSEKSKLACISNCSRPLSSSITDRLYEQLLSPKLTLTEEQRQAVLSIAKSVPKSDVIFLSAASSNHFAEMQAMFQNLHTQIFPHMKNFTSVLIDLGLTKKERRLAVIEKAREILVYTDASIRWRDNEKFAHVLSATKQRGLQLFRFNSFARIPVHTLKQTFDYFGLEPCAFDSFPELQASIAVYKKEQFIIKTILEPWARCALEKSCMCPVPPSKVLICRGKPKHHRCHRFDQSVLGILTARAFNKDIPKFIRSQTSINGGEDNYMDIKKGHRMPEYFSRS